MTNREMVIEWREKLDRAIEVQDRRQKEMLKARRVCNIRGQTFLDAREQREWIAELAQRRWVKAQQRVARTVTFLRYLETKK